MVTVILDSQAGSCGKGKFIGYYAKKHNIEENSQKVVEL